MRIVIIPYWLQTTLLRNGLSLRDCCDKDAVKPYVSNGDLRRYQDAQDIGVGYIAERFNLNIRDLLSVGVDIGLPFELDNKENDFVGSLSDNLDAQHILVGRALTPDHDMSVHANPMALNSGEIVLAITVNVEIRKDRPGYDSEMITHFYKDLNEALFNCHVPISSLANSGLLSAYVNRLN